MFWSNFQLFITFKNSHHGSPTRPPYLSKAIIRWKVFQATRGGHTREEGQESWGPTTPWSVCANKQVCHNLHIWFVVPNVEIQGWKTCSVWWPWHTVPRLPFWSLKQCSPGWHVPAWTTTEMLTGLRRSTVMEPQHSGPRFAKHNTLAFFQSFQWINRLTDPVARRWWSRSERKKTTDSEVRWGAWVFGGIKH